MRRIPIVAGAQTRTEPAAEWIDADHALEAPTRMIRIVEAGGGHRRTRAEPKVESTDLREDLRNLHLHGVHTGDSACHGDCVSATRKTQRIRAIAKHGIDAQLNLAWLFLPDRDPLRGLRALRCGILRNGRRGVESE